jgi:hypothetical protein
MIVDFLVEYTNSPNYSSLLSVAQSIKFEDVIIQSP